MNSKYSYLYIDLNLTEIKRYKESGKTWKNMEEMLRVKINAHIYVYSFKYI